MDRSMKETPRRRITVTSSFIGISTDLQGNREGEVLLCPTPFLAGFWTDIYRRREWFFLHLGLFAA
jgi:hypothetical protein